MQRIFITFMLFFSGASLAGDVETAVYNYDSWDCYFKDGPISQANNVNQYMNSIYAETDRFYNTICIFDHKFSINNQQYAFRILFPNCEFSSDNQLITTNLVNLSSGDVDDSQYSLGFAPDQAGMTGTDINQDQNVKMVLFTNLISNDTLYLNIANIGNENINLSGFAKGIQNPYCNK